MTVDASRLCAFPPRLDISHMDHNVTLEDTSLSRINNTTDNRAGQRTSEDDSNSELEHPLRSDLTGSREKLDAHHGELDDSASAQSHAMEIHTDDPMQLDEQGRSLYDRFRRLNELEDLHRSIIIQQRAVELMDENYDQKPRLLYNLGLFLQTRFERLGDLEDIQHSISVLERTVALTPEGHPDRPKRLGSLADSVHYRYERLGELDDLENAIATGKLALELTPEGHPDRPMRLGNLADSVRYRYERLGELDDLENAIATEKLALELTPEGHPDRPMRLGNLANSVCYRYQRLGELDDLENAITTEKLALELTPEGHPNRPMRLGNLAASRQLLYERLGELHDLENAIATKKLALELTPEGHPDRPMRLANLANSVCYRYERLGELDDLENAIATEKLALELTPKGHPDRPMRLGNLAAFQQLRYQRLGELDDLENAIATKKLALELMPESHPDRSGRLHNLGVSLSALFEQHPSKMNFDAAFNRFMEATTQLLGNPSHRLLSAQKCVSLLSKHPEFGSTELLLDAHSRIIQIFPEIVWLGHSINRRYEESAKLGEVVNAAISAFIGSRSRYQAIEWMEIGRSLIWSQLLSLREPIDDLNAAHPELAAELQAVSLALQQSGNLSYSAQRELESSGESTQLSVPQPTSAGPAIPGGVASDTAADRHRQLAIKYRNILKNVREQEGFQSFLQPPSITARMPSIERLDGPVVFINVHSSSCDALALFPNGAVRHIALPDLTRDGARNLHFTWTKLLGSSNVRRRGAVSLDRLVSEFRCTNVFGIVLWKLWTWVVRPILQALHFMESTHSEPLPHITWCPTGPLTQLPLHAAGIYDFTQPARSQRVFDFVVSSYTPSLSALLRSREGLSARPSPSQPNVLVVAQPETPGYAILPHTRHEGERVGSVLPNSAPTLLIDKAATVEGTIAAMRESTWVHLACHGYQKKEDPTRSAFALYNGPLTLGALMGEVAENAELAFLSACETAVGDEKIPEESAHLAAGMLAVGFKGVIGTMWSIGDADAPIVVEAYYRKLLELRGSGAVREGYTGAAYALHDAVRVLREQVGEKNFVRWAPFVHFGV